MAMRQSSARNAVFQHVVLTYRGLRTFSSLRLHQKTCELRLFFIKYDRYVKLLYNFSLYQYDIINPSYCLFECKIFKIMTLEANIFMYNANKFGINITTLVKTHNV